MVVVVDHANTMWCRRNRSPRGHNVRVVKTHANDNTDTVSAKSRTTRIHVLTRIFANIFAKTKIIVKPFLSVYMGPRWSFFGKKVSKILWHCPFKDRGHLSFLHSYFPSYLLSCIPPVLHPTPCFLLYLFCILPFTASPPVLHSSFQASLLSCIPPVLHSTLEYLHSSFPAGSELRIIWF